MTPTLSQVKACLCLQMPFCITQALQLTKLRLMLGVLNGEIQVIQVIGCARCS